MKKSGDFYLIKSLQIFLVSGFGENRKHQQNKNVFCISKNKGKI